MAGGKHDDERLREQELDLHVGRHGPAASWHRYRIWCGHRQRL